MAQIHNNFSDARVKQHLAWYVNVSMSRDDMCNQLGIKHNDFINYSIVAGLTRQSLV
jgi:hypothetical protein